MGGRKKIVRLKEGSACEECPLRENTVYNIWLRNLTSSWLYRFECIHDENMYLVEFW
jgi:hypothetical protein